MNNDPIFNGFLKFSFPFWLPILLLYIMTVLIYEIINEDRYNRRLTKREIENIGWA